MNWDKAFEAVVEAGVIIIICLLLSLVVIFLSLVTLGLGDQWFYGMTALIWFGIARNLYKNKVKND